MADEDQEEAVMRINVTSVLVDDQQKALRFYTDVPGFVKKRDVPLGEARWLTDVSPDDTIRTSVAHELAADAQSISRSPPESREGIK